MPAIPYLVPEFVSVAAKNSVPHFGVHFPLFFLGFAHSRIFRLFRVVCLVWHSSVQIRNSGFSVFPLFQSFPVVRGPNPEFRFFRFFPLFGAPNPEFRGHGSGHVWCGHVWHALTIVPGGVSKKSSCVLCVLVWFALDLLPTDVLHSWVHADDGFQGSTSWSLGKFQLAELVRQHLICLHTGRKVLIRFVGPPKEKVWSLVFLQVKSEKCFQTGTTETISYDFLVINVRDDYQRIPPKEGQR